MSFERQRYPAAVSSDWLVGGGEMGKLVRSMDWSSTPLGPLDAWPNSLRTTVSLALASNFPICIAWGAERVQVYNDGYWPICGTKHPRSMGQDFMECWLSAWPAIGDAFESASAGRTALLENQRVFPGGSGELEETFFTFSFSPSHDEKGEITGVVIIGFDVTQQVADRKRMDGLQRDAEAASRAKDEFLALLGHELRNPLAPILTALELMRLRDADAFVKERALIERQAQQLTTLVDDLLDVSRIARGKVELDKTRVDLGDVVAQALETVSPLLEHRRHHVKTDVPRGSFVHGDAARLGQVVSNLLSNAAKYSEAGGRITVAAEREGPEISLTVADSGIGIAPELLPRVFDLFSQGPRGIDRSQGGLGLGLSIVRNIAELHGGRVSASSEGPGLGSTFTVTLPAAKAPADTIPTATAPTTRLRPPKTRRRILVVDDNQDAAHTLAEYARELGHNVRVAFDGPRALEVASGFQPDTAVLDLGLPGMSGYELGERLRGCPGLQGIRLLAVTGYGQTSSRQASERHGFEAHLVKPVAPNELAARLETTAPS